MDCPKCGVEKNVKAGFVGEIQRYKCKNCGCLFTRSTPKGEPLKKKRQAVQLYLEGMGFRAIGRVLNVSHVSVQNWVAGAAEKMEALTPLYPAKAELVELDELHHYVGKKVIQSGYGLLLRIDDVESSQVKWVAVQRRQR